MSDTQNTYTASFFKVVGPFEEDVFSSYKDRWKRDCFPSLLSFFYCILTSPKL